MGNKLWKAIFYYIVIILFLGLANVGIHLENKILGFILGIFSLIMVAVFVLRYIKMTKR